MSTVDTTCRATGSPSQPAVPRAAGQRPCWRRALPWLALVAAVAAGVGAQTQMYAGQERTASTILMFVSLAVAWNLIGGFTGYACFGQVGFFGLGGYAAAVLMTHLHVSFWLALPASAILAGGFAALVGAPLLRLRGHYFAVATLGVAEGLREVVTNLPGLTGGGAGITIPTVNTDAATPWLGNDGFYTLFLVLAGVLVAVGLLVSTSRAGYALRAINQDEDAAAAMGINTTLAKTTVLAVSAALTGAVGAAYAFQQVTIFPQRLFDVDITVLMVVMVVLGGVGTVVGPVIGAVSIAFASEWLRQNYPTMHTFLLGGFIIAAVILLPQGFTNFLHDAVRTRRCSLLANVRRFRL
jgi:branched-chain amino acid transport system permease protein